MPRPTSGDSHVNSLLTNLAVKPLLKPRMFAAADIFPICPVEKQSDAYVVYDTGDFLRDEAAKERQEQRAEEEIMTSIPRRPIPAETTLSTRT
jgi:hypothetical protein